MRTVKENECKDVKKEDTLSSKDYRELTLVLLEKIKGRETLRLAYKYIRSLYINGAG